MALCALVVGGLSACGNNDDGDVTDIDETIATVLENAATDVSQAADDAGGAIADAADEVDGDNDAADEGSARDYAKQMQAMLSALPNGGEATVANLQEAAKLVPAPGQVTGIEDSDGDSKDDDAKATVEVGDDKACVQSQDAVWEVTDDEC